MSDKSIDSILENLDVEKIITEVNTEKQAVTIWLPKEYCEKYRELQGRTRRKFARTMQEVFKLVIDKAS